MNAVALTHEERPRLVCLETVETTVRDIDKGMLMGDCPGYVDTSTIKGYTTPIYKPTRGYILPPLPPQNMGYGVGF
ncbi:MAG: hypothetical protein ABIH82_02725 [Candidatus Woesearchaeota archaeon]